MIDSNLCRCGHTRARHTLTRSTATVPHQSDDDVAERRLVGVRVESVTVEACCRDCDCDGFVRDPRAGWFPFVRAAELVLAEHFDSFEVNMTPGTTPRVWNFTLRTTSDVDIGAPPGVSEREELAELTAGRWLDESQLATGKVRALAAEAFDCSTCCAEPGKPCTPMHDGERGPGGWAHPIRGTSSCTTESAVVRWAHRVKRGELSAVEPEYVTSRRPGETDAQLRERIGTAAREHKARPTNMQLVDEIIALAHINECLTVVANAKGASVGHASDVMLQRVLAWAHSNIDDQQKRIDGDPITVAALAATIRRLDSALREMTKEWKTQTDARVRTAHKQGNVPRASTLMMIRVDSEQLAVNDEVELVGDNTVRRRRPGRARYGYVTQIESNRRRAWIRQDPGVSDDVPPRDSVGNARQTCGACSGTGVGSVVAPSWVGITSFTLPCDCRAGDVAVFITTSGGRISGADVKRRIRDRQQGDDRVDAMSYAMNALAPPVESGRRTSQVPERPFVRMRTGASVLAENERQARESSERKARDVQLRVAFSAVREGDADADQRALVMQATIDCGCTRSSPCEEHASYW